MHLPRFSLRRRLKSKSCAAMAAAVFLSSGCSAEMPKANLAKDAEVSVACDKANNTYNLNYTRLAKSQNLSSFSFNDSSQLKTTLTETCALSNGVSIEIDFNLSRKSEFVKAGVPENHTSTLTKSSMDMLITSNQQTIARVIGVNYYQRLVIKMNDKKLEICPTQVGTTYCRSHNIDEANKASRSIDEIGSSSTYIK